jgi:hypothetical protein
MLDQELQDIIKNLALNKNLQMNQKPHVIRVTFSSMMTTMIINPVMKWRAKKREHME